MQHKSFVNSQCPVARTLEQVGEWWSILILRDAMLGSRRFDQFQKSLDIAPSMLTRRLNKLVDAGLLERTAYSQRPPRYEYVLTDSGRDFRSVMWSMIAWGNKHLAPEGPSVVIADAATGLWADPVLVDRQTGRELDPSSYRAVAGPAAGARLKARYAQVSPASGAPFILMHVRSDAGTTGGEPDHE